MNSLSEFPALPQLDSQALDVSGAASSYEKTAPRRRMLLAAHVGEMVLAQAPQEQRNDGKRREIYLSFYTSGVNRDKCWRFNL